MYIVWYTENYLAVFFPRFIVLISSKLPPALAKFDAVGPTRYVYLVGVSNLPSYARMYTNTGRPIPVY